MNNLKVVGIQNFQSYNFMSDFVPGITLIQITGANPVNLAGTNVALNNSGKLPGGGGQRFFPGQSMTLIDKTENTPASMSMTNPIARNTRRTSFIWRTLRRQLYAC